MQITPKFYTILLSLFTKKKKQNEQLKCLKKPMIYFTKLVIGIYIVSAHRN